MLGKVTVGLASHSPCITDLIDLSIYSTGRLVCRYIILVFKPDTQIYSASMST